MNFSVENEIRSTVKNAIQKAKSELKFKYSGSNIVNEDDVKSLIKPKADRSEVISYLETKSNIQETQTTLNAIDTLHGQLKHL